ncbi:hypothetical protein EI011_24325, partial [Escherichia coli]
AIKCSFISCRTDEERYVVECTIVEFLTAMEFTAAESIDVLKQSDGNDIETDDVIDRLIKSFEEEIE